MKNWFYLLVASVHFIASHKHQPAVAQKYNLFHFLFILMFRNGKWKFPFFQSWRFENFICYLLASTHWMNEWEIKRIKGSDKSVSVETLVHRLKNNKNWNNKKMNFISFSFLLQLLHLMKNVKYKFLWQHFSLSLSTVC